MGDSGNNSKTVTIVVAVISLIGVLGAALIASWDKIFPSNSNQSSSGSIATPMPNHNKRETNIKDSVNNSVSGTVTPTVSATVTPTPDHSVREINNNDPDIRYNGNCGYNHGLSALLYNDDVQICNNQNDSFTYTFTGKSIYLVTVYHQGKGGLISCYIDNSFTESYNLDSNKGVDSFGLAYGVVLPIAPALVYGRHTASCKMTSANTTFYVDALIINK